MHIELCQTGWIEHESELAFVHKQASKVEYPTGAALLSYEIW